MINNNFVKNTIIAPVYVAVPNGIDVNIQRGSIVIFRNDISNNYNADHLLKWLNIEYDSDKRLIIISVVAGQEKFGRKIQRTLLSIIKSLIIGIDKPFVKKLRVVGMGYYFEIANTNENVSKTSLSSSSNVELRFHYRAATYKSFVIRSGITVELVDKENLTLSSPSKWLVGEVAKNIRLMKPPGRYRGEGIRYLDEVIKLKTIRKASDS